VAVGPYVPGRVPATLSRENKPLKAFGQFCQTIDGPQRSAISLWRRAISRHNHISSAIALLAFAEFGG